jgi:hypothetical protein
MNIEFAMLRIHVCDDLIDSWKGDFQDAAASLSPYLLHHGWIYLRMGGYYDGYPRIQNGLLTSIHSFHVMSCHGDNSRYLLFDKQFHVCIHTCSSHSTWNFSSLSNK